MDRKITDLLNENIGNHIAPFFWQHGETEEVLREYMEVIQNSGCQNVCVESRPHPDYCGPKWWEDMDIIMDEARKRGMKVWVLDDSHFPTGFANGALEGSTDFELYRQSVFANPVEQAPDGQYDINIFEYVRPPEIEPSLLASMVMKMSPPPTGLGEDELLSVVAVSGESCLDVTDKVTGGRLIWKSPDSSYQLYVNGLTRNAGAHRTYINMMLKESCQLLIDEVYEKHYEHYKDDFGTTLAGFFSDEPELGNGMLYVQNNPLGTLQDLPWSHELERALTEHMGDSWKTKLPLLWTSTGTQAAAQFRYTFMNYVTRLVQKDFSEQLGDWCRAHGVAYIGHIIEDEGQHARTGSSLGHYFRGLRGQDMAGIDDIGGQVMPNGEDFPVEGLLGRIRNGEFYHYGLATLAASAAAIEPRKKGRAMCEIFGNYGWEEGVQLETFLADHFLVRGINYFVPHAFSAKNYPDPDCPPHFYAHGHNPQYRHFGQLIRYINRVSALFSDGTHKVSAAVLYHAEAEWAGEAMPFEKVSRALIDNQINSDVIPIDVFTERDYYQTVLDRNRFTVNTQEYPLLIVPAAEFIPAEAVAGINELQEQGIPVIFIDNVPQTIADEMDLTLLNATVLSLSELPNHIRRLGLAEVNITPASNRLRFMHYVEGCDKYMIVNEGNSPYVGTVTLPSHGTAYRYDAYNNKLEYIKSREVEKGTAFDITVMPLKSLIIVFDKADESLLSQPLLTNGEIIELIDWTRSQCPSITYPQFENYKKIDLPDNLAEEEKEFSGFVRYDTKVDLTAGKHTVLEITDAYEGVEVFINDISLGIQLTAPYCYDLTSYIIDGSNHISIEVATTLERERYYATESMSLIEHGVLSVPKRGSGITGCVNLYIS